MPALNLDDPFIAAALWIVGGTCVLIVLLLLGYAVLDRVLRRRERDR